MGKLLIWSMKRMVDMIVAILRNKFDAQIYIEGKRGLGKSTLAYELAWLTALRFKKLAKEIPELEGKYTFKPKRDLLYKRDKVIDFFEDWNRIAIADEFINTAFNRDFYQEEQKTLIKIINMNRDHCNLFIGCVPQFQTLDTQIKNLCKIRLTVIRRGIAVLQTPNHTIYIKDIWDATTNEKIEREWIKKGLTKPRYTNISTVRGVIKFPDLSPPHREKYEKVKIEERTILQRERKEKEVVKLSPVDDAIERLLDNRIKNGSVIEGLAYAHDIPIDSFKKRITAKLSKMGKPHHLGEYFWEGRRRKEIQEERERKKMELKQLQQMVKVS